MLTMKGKLFLHKKRLICEILRFRVKHNESV